MPIIEFDAPFESAHDGSARTAHRFGGGESEFAMTTGIMGRSLNNGVGWVQVIRAARHETMRFESAASFHGPDARRRRPLDPRRDAAKISAGSADLHLETAHLETAHLETAHQEAARPDSAEEARSRQAGAFGKAGPASPDDDLGSARGIALGAIAGLTTWVLIAHLIASFFF